MPTAPRAVRACIFLGYSQEAWYLHNFDHGVFGDDPSIYNARSPKHEVFLAYRWQKAAREHADHVLVILRIKLPLRVDL